MKNRNGRILAAAILAALLTLTGCHSDPCWAHGGTKKYTQSGTVGVFWCNDGTNSVANGLGS
jgi:hypothetical protein